MAQYKAQVGSYSLVLYMDLSESVDSANNKSTISYNIYLRKDYDGSYSYSYQNWFKFAINGGPPDNFTDPGAVNSAGQGIGWTKGLASGSVEVPHDADGSKTIRVYAQYFQPQGSGTIATIDEQFVLTKIARNTVPTLSASSREVGQAVTINLPRSNAAYTHNLWWKGGTADWTAITTGAGTSYNWTLPTSIANAFPNSTSGTITILCRTFSGSTQIGNDVWTSMTATIPASYVPSAPSLTITDGKGYQAQYGKYIQRYSSVRVVASSSGSYGSTIKGYSTVIDGSTYSGSTVESSVINKSGSISIKTTVTDSRGRTNSTTTSVSFTAYSTPTISSATVFRSNSSGTRDEISGSYIRVSASANFTPITGGTRSNTLTYLVQYRATSTASFTQADSQTSTTSPYSRAATYGNGTISVSNTYTVRITVSDAFSSSYAEYTISSAAYPMDISADGTCIAFGQVADDSQKHLILTDWDITSGNIFSGNKRAQTDGNTGVAIMKEGGIEISHNTTPYIDFHYAHENSDYTSRIIEESKGLLAVTGNLRVNNGLYADNGLSVRYGKILYVADASNVNAIATDYSGIFIKNRSNEYNHTIIPSGRFLTNVKESTSSGHYIHLLRFTFRDGATYTDSEIRFNVMCRSYSADVTVKFSGGSSLSNLAINHVLVDCHTTGTVPDVRVSKPASNIYDVYVKNLQSYEQHTVNYIYMSDYMADRCIVNSGFNAALTGVPGNSVHGEIKDEWKVTATGSLSKEVTSAFNVGATLAFYNEVCLVVTRAGSPTVNIIREVMPMEMFKGQTNEFGYNRYNTVFSMTHNDTSNQISCWTNDSGISFRLYVR